MEHYALQRGWHPQGKFWVPIEEPLSLPSPNGVKNAEVTFKLKSILFGSIAIEVTAGGARLDLVLDDVRDYPITFARFVQVLTAGGLPHAAMTDETWCDIVINDGPEPDQCRLLIDNTYPGREACIDTFTDRKRLVDAFRKLAWEIGDHPYFAHHFLYHGLPIDEYTRVAEAHDKDWAAGLQQGIYPDDIDVEDALLASRIVEGLTLPADWDDETARFRKMMRSLEIPPDWQLRFGLRAIVTIEEVAYLIEPPNRAA
ncbi:hypothetical protein ASD45_14455 [Pseudolabrys sp. Root1462]|nr:hypothetical protein ASD45_14455 [Pseudolabrys sp. Root1462]